VIGPNSSDVVCFGGKIFSTIFRRSATGLLCHACAGRNELMGLNILSRDTSDGLDELDLSDGIADAASTQGVRGRWCVACGWSGLIGWKAQRVIYFRPL
jgi:hypothetical protein